MKTGQKLHEQNIHIDTEEIIQDIRDTEAEIIQMEREVKGLRIINDKMSNFRADGKEGGIQRRKTFVDKLNSILKYRTSPEDVKK